MSGVGTHEKDRIMSQSTNLDLWSRDSWERPNYVTEHSFRTYAEPFATHDSAYATLPDRLAGPGGRAGNARPHSGNQVGSTGQHSCQHSCSRRSVHTIGGQAQWHAGLAPALSVTAGTDAPLGTHQPGRDAAHRCIPAGPDTHRELYRSPPSTARWRGPRVRGHGAPTQWLG